MTRGTSICAFRYLPIRKHTAGIRKPGASIANNCFVIFLSTRSSTCLEVYLNVRKYSALRLWGVTVQNTPYISEQRLLSTMTLNRVAS